MFYKFIVNDNRVLVEFIVQMAKAIKLFQQENFVHGNLKASNLMCVLEDDNAKFGRILVSDFSFGFKLNQSSDSPLYFNYDNLENMPPEVIEYLILKDKKGSI